MGSSINNSSEEILILKKRIAELEKQVYKFKSEAEVMRNYLDNAPILAMSIDLPTYRVNFANKNMIKSLGKNENDIIGKYIFNVYF